MPQELNIAGETIENAPFSENPLNLKNGFLKLCLSLCEMMVSIDFMAIHFEIHRQSHKRFET